MTTTAVRWDGSDTVQLAEQTDPWLQVGDVVVDLDDLPEVDGPCEEMGHVAIPGVLHMNGNGPNWIERCDGCDLFPGDLHAAQALADHLNIGAVVWLLPRTNESKEDTSMSDIDPTEPEYRARPDRTIESVADLVRVERGGELDGSEPQVDNETRASFAARAIEAYAEATGNDDLYTVFSDFMGDVQHLLDVLREFDNGDGIGTIDGLVHNGTVHYEAEIRGEL